jgi:hypothetical protein
MEYPSTMVVCQWPLPNCHNCWNIIRTIQNIHSNMIFTKLIIKNYLPWVTSYYTAIYNEQPKIIHKLTFHTSPNTLTFWQNVRVLSSVFIITSFLLFFTICFIIPLFIHRIKKTSFHNAIITRIIKNISIVSIRFILLLISSSMSNPSYYEKEKAWSLLDSLLFRKLLKPSSRMPSSSKNATSSSNMETYLVSQK